MGRERQVIGATGGLNVIRVYGYERSSNVQKVTWLCDELGVRFEMVPKGGPHGGHKEADYLRLNPNGQIPTIDDGGFILWESNSILRYVAEQHGGGRLIPATSQKRAIANKWMDWQLAALGRPSTALVNAVFRKAPAERNSADVAGAIDGLATQWRRFESDFGTGPFVAGDFSIGDIALAIYVHRWYAADVEKPAFPILRAWYERIAERPAFRARVAAAKMPGQA
jgi:glutathione S-transferase